MSAPIPSRGSRSSSGRNPFEALVPALIPALIALLFAAWCGTVPYGASAAGAIAAHVVLLGSAVWVGLDGARNRTVSRSRPDRPDPLDPLRLGRSGRLLPWALLAVVALAWWVSPVRRAGVVGVVLLPALLFAPAAVARCWRGGPSRARLGVLGIAGAVAVVSLWSLVAWWTGPGELPGEPLGHHLFLVAWVVTLLPLAALPLADGRTGRLPGGLALTAGVTAVVATRSLGGVLALVTEGAVAVLLVGRLSREGGRGRVLRWGERIAALGLVAALGAILFAVWSGDPSIRARSVYWRAGWQGVLERPWTGFGPGASAWTLAAHLRPVPGINPPGEVVGEVHLLPLAVAYEIGLPGLALALGIAAVFALRRVRDSGDLPAGGGAGGRGRPGLVIAGLAGLAGAATMGVATADWRILALPVAAAIAAGAALSGTGASGLPGGDGEADGAEAGRRRRLEPVVMVVYVVATGIVLLPLERAHVHYDRAFRHHAGDSAGSEEMRTAVAAQLEAAVRLDPEHPLYRFHAGRESWLAGQAAPGRPRAQAMEAARRTLQDALGAAEDASGVAALWLRAGAAADAAGEPALAAPAFETACGLDPFGAAAPFGLLAVGSPLHRPEALGARALAAEPRLGAALFWEERPELLERVLRVLEGADGIDPGWREETVRRVRELHAGAPAGSVATIAVVVDGTPAGSLSLHAFRRLPWRVALLPVPVRRRGAEALTDLPPATTLRGTDPRLFPPTCTGLFSPQTLRKTLRKTW